MSSRNNTQLYIGNLPRDIHRDEIYKEFNHFGKIREVKIKNRYAFVVSSLVC